METTLIPKKAYDPIQYVDDAPLVFSNQKIDGRTLGRKTVGDDKVLNLSSIPDNTITTAMIQALAISTAKIANAAINQSKLSYETANVSISAGNPSGTASVTSGSIILGWYATSNQDQLVDSIAVSGTTLTITLAANATGTNTFTVVLLKA